MDGFAIVRGRSGPVVAPAVHTATPGCPATQLASVLPAASMSGFTMALSCVARGALSMIRYYGRLMMGLLMDESARRSYDADREDLGKKADGHRFLGKVIRRHPDAVQSPTDA